MWRSGTSFNGLAVALALLLTATAASAKVLMTADEALELAFPGAAIERRVKYLTKQQLARAAALCGQAVRSALVTRYRATRDGRVVGFAYLDTHRVRTLPETLLIIVDAKGRVQRVEVLSFREPEDYLPRRGWYGQFDRKVLDDDLRTKRGIRMMTGATLTSRATTAAVRRVLAVHAVLEQGGSG